MQDPISATEALRGLEEEFEVVRELGRGGSAVVYLAIERELGREVAIKTVHPVFATDPEAAARLVREARTLARLQHPNIVTFYGVRRLADGGLAMVMQYVRGERLKDRIRSVGPLPVEETRRILADVARALAHAHRHHVVHRDIKPENIYLDSDVGLARLSDFGIARLWDQDGSLTQAGLTIGTPAYMAPEQIDGGVLDARSDIYALGLVAHEMLSGRRPWDGQNLYGIIYRQKNEALPSLTELRPDVPADLVRAIEIALAKQPDQRWPDANAFLRAIVGSAEVDAEPEPAVITALRPTTPTDAGEDAAGADPNDDAPTIPYRPAEVIASGAGEPASAVAGAPDEPSPQPGGRKMLAEAERALAEWEAAAPHEPTRIRFSRRQLSIAATLLVVFASGLGAVSFVRARIHQRSAKPVETRWVSVARPAAPAARAEQPPTPVHPVTTELAVAVPAEQNAAPASPSAKHVREKTTSDDVVATSHSRVSSSKKADGRAAARQSTAVTPRLVAPEVDAEALRKVAAPADQPSAAVPEVTPRLIGTPVAAAEALRKLAPRSTARPTDTAVVPPPAEIRNIESAPVFTPFTVAPELKNRSDVAAALAQEYPRLQRMGTPQGHVLVWLLLDDKGSVRKAQLKESSGVRELDETALRLGKLMRFSPALDRDRQVPIWVSVPIDFVSR